MTNSNEKSKNYSTEESINKLEAFLDLSFEIPRFVSVLRPTQLREHLTEIKKAVNEELEQSRSIIEKKEEIITEANRIAEDIVRKKQIELENQDIVRQAQTYAKQIVTEAQRKAQELLDEGQQVQQQLIVNGHKYVDQLLADVENNLQKENEKIAENRAELRNSLLEKQNKLNMIKL